ncbi:MAG: hypothetical protein M1824_000638 [Vezdaea acicularis]|nr:MAG: hypothetical protein M1824_000638 [Vezdaea acicularis]
MTSVNEENGPKPVITISSDEESGPELIHAKSLQSSKRKYEVNENDGHARSRGSMASHYITEGNPILASQYQVNRDASLLPSLTNNQQTVQRAARNARLSTTETEGHFNSSTTVVVLSEVPLPGPDISKGLNLWEVPAYAEPTRAPEELWISSKPAPSADIGLDTPQVPLSLVKKRPSAFTRRKRWSKAMYTDLALQLQQEFPFRAFAKKHGVSAKEVFDVFAAVVHIPLLEQSSYTANLQSSGEERLKVFRIKERDMKIIRDARAALEAQPPKPRKGHDLEKSQS